MATPTEQPRGVILPPSVSPEHPDYHRERYDVRAATAYLCVSRWTLDREIAARRISCRRGPGKNSRVMFSQADLDAWRVSRRIESRTTRPMPVPVIPSLQPLPMPRRRRFS